MLNVKALPLDKPNNCRARLIQVIVRALTSGSSPNRRLDFRSAASRNEVAHFGRSAGGFTAWGRSRWTASDAAFRNRRVSI